MTMELFKSDDPILTNVNIFQKGLDGYTQMDLKHIRPDMLKGYCQEAGIHYESVGPGVGLAPITLDTLYLVQLLNGMD